MKKWHIAAIAYTVGAVWAIGSHALNPNPYSVYINGEVFSAQSTANSTSYSVRSTQLEYKTNGFGPIEPQVKTIPLYSGKLHLTNEKELNIGDEIKTKLGKIESIEDLIAETKSQAKAKEN